MSEKKRNLLINYMESELDLDSLDSVSSSEDRSSLLDAVIEERDEIKLVQDLYKANFTELFPALFGEQDYLIETCYAISLVIKTKLLESGIILRNEDLERIGFYAGITVMLWMYRGDDKADALES